MTGTDWVVLAFLLAALAAILIPAIAIASGPLAHRLRRIPPEERDMVNYVCLLFRDAADHWTATESGARIATPSGTLCVKARYPSLYPVTLRVAVYGGGDTEYTLTRSGRVVRAYRRWEREDSRRRERIAAGATRQRIERIMDDL